ncbi:MAG: hypothetical protein U0M06_13260 [Clostridia bacterium]|nr:hypothetical protein [Clostridia bacterium]
MPTEKSLPKFYQILIFCWCAALILLAIALLVVRSYLADYESVQPKYTASQVFENYFEKSDFKSVLDHSGERISQYETNEQIASYLSSLTEGKELSYHNISSGMDTDISKYIVKYSEGEDDIKIASFTLSKTGEKSKKGFDKYALSSFEVFYPSKKSVSVKVTKGAVPYINGVPLDESYIKEENIPHVSCAHLPEGVEGIYYTLYTLDGLALEPEVKVKGADGAELALSYDSENSLYVTDIVYDETLKEELGDRVIEAAKVLAAYMQNDSGKAKLNPYYEKNTELYKSITSTLQWAVIDHDSYHFEGEEASEFYRYDDRTVSCRVKLTHVLKRKRLEDYRDTVDATFYLREIGGKYMVYDRTNN